MALVITCTVMMMVKKTQAGVDFNAILSTIVVVVPKAKMILQTLNASTLPGKTIPMRAPVFVCKNVSADPQRNATAKQSGYSFKKKHKSETNPATYTHNVPTTASLNLQNLYPILFITNPVNAWLSPKAIKTNPE